jgi:hypothetical protein
MKAYSANFQDDGLRDPGSQEREPEIIHSETDCQGIACGMKRPPKKARSHEHQEHDCEKSDSRECHTNRIWLDRIVKPRL